MTDLKELAAKLQEVNTDELQQFLDAAHENWGESLWIDATPLMELQKAIDLIEQQTKLVDDAEAERDDIQKMLAKHALLPVEDSDIQRLGARLADLLLADDFNSIEPTLNGLIEERDQLRAENEQRKSLNRSLLGGLNNAVLERDEAIARAEAAEDEGET
jgi:hypothetical protein